MRRRTEHGFSLLEVAVAIGVVAILAAAAAPLVLKALNQQREERTRRDLRTAFEALVGSRERRMPNLRADWGYTPPNGITNDLRVLLAAPPGLRPYGPDPANDGLLWGWNGPYWTGATGSAGTALFPVDGWGRPIRLVAQGGTWQVQSAGANGVFGGAVNDDLRYPEPGLVPASSQAFVVINVENTTSATLQATLVATDRNGGALRNVSTTPPTTFPQAIAPGALGKRAWTYTVNPGAVRVRMSWPPPATNTATELLDLLPGESRTLSYKIY